MTSSPEHRPAIDALPPAPFVDVAVVQARLPSRAGLILVAFTLGPGPLPDALVALWFMLLGEGVLRATGPVRIAVVAL
jgi:hypothetical protein